MWPCSLQLWPCLPETAQNTSTTIPTSLGWPYVPFSQDASWPGFLYCFDSKYLEMRFENIRNRVIHRSVCTRKQSQILDILGNTEILARTRPGKMARMVTLHKLICRGHNKTSLSEPNMSPPGRSKCFVQLFGDHLLFPLNFNILNLMFWISSSSWKLEAVFLKTGYLQSKNSEQKNLLFENICLLKNCHKKYIVLNLKCSIFKFKKSQIQNYVKCHIIFSFVKWHLSIIQICTIKIQSVLSYYKLHKLLITQNVLIYRRQFKKNQTMNLQSTNLSIFDAY